jgi:phospholipid-transporting ATPase
MMYDIEKDISAKV